jgi:hypothetical protein
MLLKATTTKTLNIFLRNLGLELLKLLGPLEASELKTHDVF